MDRTKPTPPAVWWPATWLWIASGVAILAVLLVAVWLPTAFFIDIGQRDTRFISGFHEPEPFGDGNARWTTERAVIAFPRSVISPHILSMRIFGNRPAGAPPAVLQLSGDNRQFGSFTVDAVSGSARRYHVLLPTSIGADWAQQVQLSSNASTTPQDPRLLGVPIDWFDATALRHTLLLDPWLVLVLAVLVSASMGFLRSIGLHFWNALPLAAVLAGLLAFAIAQHPLETMPFLPRLAALAVVMLAAVGLARLLTPSSDTHEGLRINGRDLPIYLGVAFWVGPLFQIIETIDGVDGVTPPPATSAILIGLALALVGFGLWVRMRAFSVETHAKVVRRGALIVLAIAAGAHMVSMLVFAMGRNAPDFWILFKGARDLAQGGSFYNMVDVTTNHFGKVFKVPPFYGMLFLPFVFQDGMMILLGHRIINLIILTATAIVWYRMWHIRVASVLGLAMIILLNFRPLADTIAYGQIDLVLLLLLTLALWALRGQHAIVAGMLVALGTLFKVYPVLLLAFFVVKREWKALFGFVLGMLVFNGIAIAVVGIEMHREYLFDVLPRIGGTTSWVENQTVSGMVARLVEPPNESEIFHNVLLSRIGLLISAGLGFATCLLSLPRTERRSPQYALQYGLFLVMMVLAVPAAWMHYETLLFVPFAALVLYYYPRTVALPEAVTLAISFALISYGNQWSYYTGTVMGVLTIVGVSYKGFGMLLLAGVVAGVLVRSWRSSRVHATQPSFDGSFAPRS